MKDGLCAVKLRRLAGGPIGPPRQSESDQSASRPVSALCPPRRRWVRWTRPRAAPLYRRSSANRSRASTLAASAAHCSS
jgi:hypothetical protein